MPRSLVLGNGSTLVGLDSRGRVKDFYYDYVGLEDHLTEEAVNKIGVWVEDKFSWFEDSEWQISIEYENETLAGKIHAQNNRLEVSLDFTDLVYNEKNIFIRKIAVHNLAKRERMIKVYLNHQFRMYGSYKKDTVYFDPADNTIVHYKGRRLALIGGTCDGDGFADYCVGLSNIEGKEGTWKDAEDGKLAKNAIEHGTVDSTIGFEKTADADSGFTIQSWVCMGKTLSEVKDLHNYVLKRSADRLIETTQDYWHAWINKTPFTFYGLNEKVSKLFKTSLLIIRTHVDNTGGIIASGDSDMLQYGRDNYTYIWHRDGANVAMALDKAGYHEVARKFYEFSNDTITDEGYFFHKYRSDKALGSSWHGWLTPDGKNRLPIQEDETALVITALWHHYQYTKDIEFIENIYNSLIKKASEFMLGFRNSYKLPNPTFDIWEQRWGIHTYTAATVYDALLSASKFAELLGKEKELAFYKSAAEEVKEATLEHLYNEKSEYFYKYIDFEGGEVLHDETIDASSFYGVFKFGLLDIDDERLEKTFETFKNKLVCHAGIGGVARYENDVYYRQNDVCPGNPWIVTTMWLAQYYIAKAKSEKDMKEVKELLNWVTDRAQLSGILSEQFNPETGEQLSASPLIWSHAEFVTTVISYLEKLEDLGICKVSEELKKK